MSERARERESERESERDMNERAEAKIERERKSWLREIAVHFRVTRDESLSASKGERDRKRAGEREKENGRERESCRLVIRFLFAAL